MSFPGVSFSTSFSRPSMDSSYRSVLRPSVWFFGCEISDSHGNDENGSGQLRRAGMGPVSSPERR